MEPGAPDTTQPTPPDPPQGQPGNTVPPNIALFLHALSVMLGYGRHLLDTIHQRAAAPTFTIIAAAFGTANLATIQAHMNRGILRAIALQRVLLARAETGRDIEPSPRRLRPDETPPAPADAAAEPPSAAPAAVAKRKPRKSRLPGSDDPELYMPTLAELERQARRRSIGRLMADICLDLGIVPILCSSDFWNEMFDILYYFGGHGVETVMAEKQRREQAFLQEQDRKIGSSLDWLQLKRDEIRQILGFFIGEPPVNPFAPDAAPATGPP
jgi:hypothetical protein